MRIYEIFNEAVAQLAIEKDDDKMTTLLDKATGVRTVIDKKNPKSPKIAQDATGKLSITPVGPGSAPKAPTIKPGTPVAVQK